MRPTPARAMAEAARILRPGGRVLALDLREHDQEWVRDRVGDRWLGFKDEDLERFLTGAGLTDVKVRVGSRLPGDPFAVLIASGVKRPEVGHDYERMTCQTFEPDSNTCCPSASSSSTARWAR